MGISFCDALLSGEVANVANKAHALHVRALLLAMGGDFAGSRASAADASALIEEFGLTLSGGVYSMDVGFALLVAGDFERAEHELRRGHDLLASVGDTGARCTVDAMLADVLQRRVSSTRPCCSPRRVVRSPPPTTSMPSRDGGRHSHGSSRGKACTTRRWKHASDAVALVDPVDLLPLKAVAHEALGDVHAAAGRIEEARAAVEQALALHEQKGNVVSAGRMRATLDELRAARPA